MSWFSTTFKTRGYEVDGSGTLPAALYLRYLEHVRWEALAASAPLAALFAEGHRMVVVSQRLALGRPLGHGVTLRAELGIGRLGRSSLDFRQELWLAGGDGDSSPTKSSAAVASALVTAVYCDAGGRPTPLPEGFRRGLALDTASPALELPPRLDEQVLAGLLAVGGDGGGRSYSAELVVRPSDCDLLRHANHASYLVYFDDARRAAAAAGVLGETSSAVTAPLAGAALDYRREALAGDTLQLRVNLLPGGDQLGCALLGEGQLLCVGRLLLGAPAVEQ